MSPPLSRPFFHGIDRHLAPIDRPVVPGLRRRGGSRPIWRCCTERSLALFHELTHCLGAPGSLIDQRALCFDGLEEQLLVDQRQTALPQGCTGAAVFAQRDRGAPQIGKLRELSVPWPGGVQ